MEGGGKRGRKVNLVCKVLKVILYKMPWQENKSAERSDRQITRNF